jgi:excisionase family DNA binding protein
MNATTKNHLGSADNVVTLPRLAYSLDETAQILGVSKITVYRLLERGLLKSSTAMRHKLIPVTEIERFLQETTK